MSVCVRTGRVIATSIGVFSLATSCSEYGGWSAHFSRAIGQVVNVATGKAAQLDAKSNTCFSNTYGTPRKDVSAEEFVNSISVNTHIPYTDGKYSQLDLVESELAYLGISHVRDGITNGEGGAASLSSYQRLAAHGVKFTFIVSANNSPGLMDKFKLVEAVAAARSSGVYAVEGPNEINNWAATFNGAKDLQAALDMQRELVSLVKKTKILNRVKVVYFTGFDAGPIGTGPDPISSGLADFDNQHVYPKGGEAPTHWVKRSMTLTNTTNPEEPAVFTEVGYNAKDVGLDTQAKYSLDMLMDSSVMGISQISFYQLMDAYRDGAAQGDFGWGLFSYAEKPKPVAFALHNLISLLKDGAPNVTGYNDSPLLYSVAGLPRSGCSFSISRSDGHRFVVVWAEEPIWDSIKHQTVPARSSLVSVSPLHPYTAVNVYDPLKSDKPVLKLSTHSAVEVEVSDHPILIEMVPSHQH